jgi:hypothetical protein
VKFCTLVSVLACGFMRFCGVLFASFEFGRFCEI